MDVEGRWVVAKERLGLAGVSFYTQDGQQQGPIVQDRKLYSISYDKSQWKRILKKEKICITESLGTVEINTTL